MLGNIILSYFDVVGLICIKNYALTSRVSRAIDTAIKHRTDTPEQYRESIAEISKFDKNQALGAAAMQDAEVAQDEMTMVELDLQDPVNVCELLYIYIS